MAGGPDSAQLLAMSPRRQTPVIALNPYPALAASQLSLPKIYAYAKIYRVGHKISNVACQDLLKLLIAEIHRLLTLLDSSFSPIPKHLFSLKNEH